MPVIVLLPMDICPKAPGNAQTYVDQIVGYVLWGVLLLFGLSVAVAVGAILIGRLFHMPMASKVGVVSLVVTFVCVVLYLVLPGMVNAMLKGGCIPSIGGNPAPTATAKP